jgi:hypothetical protein
MLSITLNNVLDGEACVELKGDRVLRLMAVGGSTCSCVDRRGETPN